MATDEVSLSWNDCTDDIHLAIAGCLPPSALVALQCTSQHLASLSYEPHWRALCAARWQDKPRYRLTEERERWLDANLAHSWQFRYVYFERDSRRAHLTERELEALIWHFNFTVSAGGQARELSHSTSPSLPTAQAT